MRVYVESGEILTAATWRELWEQEGTPTLYVMRDVTVPEEASTRMGTLEHILWDQLEYVELLQEAPEPSRREDWRRRLRDDFTEDGRMRSVGKGGRCMLDRVADLICEAASAQREMAANSPMGTAFIRLRAMSSDSEWRRVGDVR